MEGGYTDELTISCQLNLPEYVVSQPARTIFYSDWHCHVLKRLHLIICRRDRPLMSLIRITLADTDNDCCHIPSQTDSWQTH